MPVIPLPTPTQVVFVLTAALTLGGALGVVTARSVFVSALFLIASFSGVAVLYVLLEAGFLAAVQILIYVGAIAVLMLFAIMLTRRVMTRETPQTNEQWAPAATIAVTLFGLLGLTVLGVEWPVTNASPPEDSVTALAEALLGPYVLPFEVISIILLVALIGAIIIAREE